VEPNFRDSFCIAHPTPRYAAVLEGLPSAAVADRVSAERRRCCSSCRLSPASSKVPV
jgi:hypothetical protein